MKKNLKTCFGWFSISTVWTLLVLILFISGCQDEQERPTETQIQFSISTSQVNGRSKENEVPNAVIATVINSNGDKIIDHETFELHQFGESFLSVPITLPADESIFRVTEFFVLVNNEIKFVTPREGSDMAHLVSDPLDKEFTVSKDQITTVELEVVSVGTGTPQDYGYGQFAFDIINTKDVVFASFIKGMANFELTESHLKIEGLESETSSTPLWTYETDLEPKANIIKIKDANFYRVTASKSGYENWSKTMPLNNGDATEIIFFNKELSFETIWNKHYGGSLGDYSGQAIPTSDGGQIMIGYTSSTDHDVVSPLGGSDVWAVKLNSSGAIEWSKNYGTSADERSGRPLIEFADGSGYLISGYTYGYDANDVLIDRGWLMKIGHQGNIIWEKSTGKNDYHTGTIVGSGSNDIVLAGHPSTLMRIDGDGNTIWEKTVPLYTGNKGGITNVENGFMLIGRFHDNIHDNFVKFNWNGDIQWESTPYEPLGPYAGAIIASVLDDGYIVFGSDQETSSPNDLHKNSDVFISKISLTGQVVWKRKILSTPDRKEYVYSATRTSTGNYLIVGMVSKAGGYFSQAAWIAEVTSEGEVRGERILKGTSSINAPGRSVFTQIIKQANHYIILGITDQTGGNIPGNYGGYSDIWAMKIGF